MTDQLFGQRRDHTAKVLGEVAVAMEGALGGRGSREYEEAIGDHTTVYVIGSCGRGDMGPRSDLDAYVVRLDDARHDNADAVRAALETAVRDCGLPELDGEGKYAQLVSASGLFEHLGSPEDDETGALTRRMLLLLESAPLLNPDGYDALVDRAIEAYWKNDHLHPNDYLPLVLVNDIVRYWRTLLLNHESRLARKGPMSRDEELARRRYSSYKLRFPRCLSCFSVLMYFLAVTREDPAHVARGDVRDLVRLSPLERLAEIERVAPSVADRVAKLRSLYAVHLERTEPGKHIVLTRLREDSQLRADVSKDGEEFTRIVFELVQELGAGGTLHRHMVV